MKAALLVILLAPLAGFLVNVFFGRRLPKAGVTAVAVGSVGLSACLALWVCGSFFLAPQPAAFNYYTVLSVGGITVPFSLQADALSVLMLFFVTFVGFWIHVYSVGYMGHEEGYARFFSYLNLFMFAMLTLILADNFLLMFVGWEGVGLCSYLLIGFYYQEEWPANSGKKAFIVNRIGDFGFLLGIFFIAANFGSLRYAEVFAKLQANPEMYMGVAGIIALCLFVGATGKSAQLPLYVWLPDAMAGPTPVSALIHAATMVTAGVYMVARCNLFFRSSPEAMAVVAVVGGLTAIFAASMGLAQRDVKKVLAYSTISQLGYMFLAAGVGAYAVAMFHVFTHAFFKACLFLGSGSLIHACHTNDIFEMGGLKKVMKTTHWTFFFSTLAIAGIPIWAGFFSKDAILASVYAFAGHHHAWAYLLYGLAVVTAFMTSFYMFRLYYIVFGGEYRGHGHPHESPRSMTVPLQVLGGLSAVVGFLGVPAVVSHWFHVPNVIERFLEPLTPEVEGLAPTTFHLTNATEIVLILLSIGIAAAGWMLAKRWYGDDPSWGRAKAFTARFPRLHKTVFDKYYVDEFYDKTAGAALRGAGRFCFSVIDGIFIEGPVNLSGFFVELTGSVLRFLHNGNLRTYALHIVLGVAILLWLVF
jgi:NADH-quinone oxidoreductase subunit L